MSYPEGTRVHFAGAGGDRGLGVVAHGGTANYRLVTWDGGVTEYVSTALLDPSDAPHPVAEAEVVEAPVVVSWNGLSEAVAASETPDDDAPVLVEPPARRSGPARRWTADEALERLRAWAGRFGAAPSSIEWDPAMARAQGVPHRAGVWVAERGDWPSSAQVKTLFGSWGAGLTAAGLTPKSPGGRGNAPRGADGANRSRATPPPPAAAAPSPTAAAGPQEQEQPEDLEREGEAQIESPVARLLHLADELRGQGVTVNVTITLQVPA